MRKILLICLLFTGMLASSCEDTCDEPCIEVKLLDVVYISERYNFNPIRALEITKHMGS
jgi:hypothetical protein